MRNRDRTLICGHALWDRGAGNAELKAAAWVRFGEVDWPCLRMAYLSYGIVCPQIAWANPICNPDPPIFP